MYGGGNDRDRLRNGLAWVEYKSFSDNSYDVLLYDLEFGEDYRLDLVKADFEEEIVDAAWCYTSNNELDMVEESARAFSEIMAENYLHEADLESKLAHNFIRDDQVTFTTINDTPRVEGDLMVDEENDLFEELKEFSEGLFETPLSDKFHYETIWAQGEDIYD